VAVLFWSRDRVQLPATSADVSPLAVGFELGSLQAGKCGTGSAVQETKSEHALALCLLQLRWCTDREEQQQGAADAARAAGARSQQCTMVDKRQACPAQCVYEITCSGQVKQRWLWSSDSESAQLFNIHDNATDSLALTPVALLRAVRAKLGQETGPTKSQMCRPGKQSTTSEYVGIPNTPVNHASVCVSLYTAVHYPTLHFSKVLPYKTRHALTKPHKPLLNYVLPDDKWARFHTPQFPATHLLNGTIDGAVVV
jgi:hypothetical protein